jgi:autophagy-related protein 101
MNCKENYLPELELSTGQVREALQCILHTILFIRSPGSVAPRDVECEGFGITYPRIASDNKSSRPAGTASIPDPLENDVDKKVDDAIESFLRKLSQIGPELMSGSLTLSFFERRASRQLFGLVSHEERVVFEQWILRVVVNNTPRPISDDSAAVIERQRIQDTAEGMLRSVLFKIFEISGGAIEHLPPVMYEFEIHCAKRADDRENVYSRVSNMPALINLSN